MERSLQPPSFLLQIATSRCSEPGRSHCGSPGLFAWFELCCAEKSLPKGECESHAATGLSAVAAVRNKRRACPPAPRGAATVNGASVTFSYAQTQKMNFQFK